MATTGASAARRGGMVVAIVVTGAAMFVTALATDVRVRDLGYALIGMAGFAAALRGRGGPVGAEGRGVPAPVRVVAATVAFSAAAYGVALYLGEPFAFVARVTFVAGVLAALARVLVWWVDGPAGPGTGRGG